MIDLNKCVYINCPFDKDYADLFLSIEFTFVYFGFNPKTTLFNTDCGTTRLDKIFSIIEECSLSLHDISRLKSQTAQEYFRLNMAFELGLDYCYKKMKNKNKKMLIMSKNKYDYHKALSDISALDIVHHNNNYQRVITLICNWIKSNFDELKINNKQVISCYETQFQKNLFERYGNNYNVFEIPFCEITDIINEVKEQ